MLHLRVNFFSQFFSVLPYQQTGVLSFEGQKLVTYSFNSFLHYEDTIILIIIEKQSAV